MSEYKKKIAVIPEPFETREDDGFFALDQKTVILVSNDTECIGQYLQELILHKTGFSLSIQEVALTDNDDNRIILIIDHDIPGLGDEGYLLQVSSSGIRIKAPKPAGIFYGIQTLRQLIQGEDESGKIIPAVQIQDKPRFHWRGLMLDVGRHFYPPAFIKRFIDLMALHKKNVFHWHLTEDQGWRIEVKKYPRLHQIGSERDDSQVAEDRDRLDGKPHGGYYTQEQIKEIVAYAASRFITIIPEIEMPGHSLAALASYPELGCTGGPYEVQSTWGIKKDVYCAGNENVYSFLEDVLSEILDLFPSPVIHIGGDEAPKDRWQNCPKCQGVRKKQGLKDEDELQSYFIKRIANFLSAKGRQLIGWDEILEGGLAPNAMVMSWRGIDGGIQAASAGHDVVMSPTSHCYFDYYQSKNTREPAGPYWEGAYLPLETVYAYEPIPHALSADQHKHILGAQGNIWTEFIASEDHLDYMVYPRGTALSEVVWSFPKKRNFEGFLMRLESFLPILDEFGVKYRNPFNSVQG
jgi:hexosaminidase